MPTLDAIFLGLYFFWGVENSKSIGICFKNGLHGGDFMGVTA